MAVANQAEIFPNEKHSPTEEEIVRVVLQVIAYRNLPREMALTGRPSVGAPVGVRAAGGGPPALGR